MRDISDAAVAVLAGPTVPLAVLVEMDLSTPLRLCSWGSPLTWQGVTYMAAGTLGSVDATDESTDQPRPLRFTLSGLPSSQIAQVLLERVQNKPVRIYIAVLDPATRAVVDAALEWRGALDSMNVRGDGRTETITVTAESAGLDLLRAVPVRYTDVDQQRLHPGDRFFEFVTDQAERNVIWPTADYFRR